MHVDPYNAPMKNLDHMLQSKQGLFFMDAPRIFQREAAKSHSARVTRGVGHTKRVRVLDWSASSPDLSLSPIENVFVVHSIEYML